MTRSRKVEDPAEARHGDPLVGGIEVVSETPDRRASVFDKGRVTLTI